MSFQFPADPKDGTIIVNGDIKGTYDEATNTWQVEKMLTVPGVPGPPGPQGDLGPVGPPGAGVQVTGSVPTYDDLPTEPQINTFWIVDDTNTLYFWNGTEYQDLGGPIRGPKGDKGDTGENGEDGSDGIDGDDGDGWYGTEIITDNDEYKIKFKSTEAYLEFTTDNLKGEPGNLQVASATNIGGIKIGRGLDIDSEGTATAGTTDVRIETVPLPGSYTQTFQPLYLNFGTFKEESSSAYQTLPGWIVNEQKGIQMPENSDTAAIFWFAGAVLDVTPSANGYSAPNGSMGTFRAFFQNILSVTGGVFSSGGNSATVQTNLNMTMAYYRKDDGTTTMDGRGSTNQLCKFDVVSYPTGGSLDFKWTINILEMSRGRIASGGLRMMILPYQSNDVAASNFVNQCRMLATYDGPDIDSDVIAPTPEQVKDINGGDLHNRVNTAVPFVDALLLTFTDEVDQTILKGYRAELVDLINLPGTYDNVDQRLTEILNAVNEGYAQNTYRFQD